MDDTENHQSPPESADDPAPEPEPIPEGYAPNPEPSAETDKPKQDSALDRDMVRWTRVVGIFTIVLAVIGGIQAWAFVQSERAAIYPQFDRIDPTPVVADQRIAIDVSLINNGRAGAFFSEARVAVRAGTFLPDEPDYSTATFTTSGVIPPQNRRYIHFGPVEDTLNWAQVDDINRGVAHLWVYGFVKFTDDFSFFGSKIIGFCGLYVSPKEMGSAKYPGAPIAQCDNPNYDYSR